MKRSKMKSSGCKYEHRTKEEKYIYCARDGSLRKIGKGCKGQNSHCYKKSWWQKLKEWLFNG